MRLAMLLLLVLAAGCGPRLLPGPGTHEVEGRGEGAVTSAKGIELVARARAWEGDPWDLSERVTPMLVTIANEGDVPVHIRYYDIRLFSDAGRAYFPLRPF